MSVADDGGSSGRLRRDLGVTCLRLDRPGEAAEHLQAYLDRTEAPQDAEVVGTLIRAARRDLAARN